jgi:hypothetical protein
MSWTDLVGAFAYGGTLSSSAMQSMRDNMIAVCSGTSGAPKFADNSFDLRSVNSANLHAWISGSLVTNGSFHDHTESVIAKLQGSNSMVHKALWAKHRKFTVETTGTIALGVGSAWLTTSSGMYMVATDSGTQAQIPEYYLSGTWYPKIFLAGSDTNTVLGLYFSDGSNVRVKNYSLAPSNLYWIKYL